MKTYKKITQETEVPVSLICDVCKKEYDYEKDVMEIQEFNWIGFTGGYGSVFGDNVTFYLDICQHCLNDKLGQYLRRIDE